MKFRTMVLVLVCGLVAGLSGCAVPRAIDQQGPRSGRPMMAMMSSSERAFLAEMIPHHEEAVLAAGELARSARPEMRRLGEDIARSQTAQIEQMRGWLALWYPGEPEDTAYRPMMRDLTGIEGDALDRAFLDDMVHHHMMAVMMAQQLLVGRAGTHEEVTDLARRISEEQRAEIAQMRTWQREWFGERGSMMSRGWQHEARAR